MYTAIYLHSYQDKIIIFYGAQLIYFLLVIQICKLYCKNHNRQLINVMSMMLMIGFVMLTRLSIDKAIRQFVFCVIATIMASSIAFLMRKGQQYRDFFYLYAIIGIGAFVIIGNRAPPRYNCALVRPCSAANRTPQSAATLIKLAQS